MSTTEYKLDPDLNVDALAAEFAAQDRIQIQKILPKEVAVRLHSILAHETPWDYMCFDGEKGQCTPFSKINDMSPQDRQALTRTHLEAAKTGFSFSYNGFNFRSEFREGNHPEQALRPFDSFLNSDPFLTFARKLINDPEVTGVEGNASWYGPGHYLNLHDDRMERQDRRAAFVFNLSPNWRVDWGGELKMFSNRRGSKLVDAFFPAFNVLNVFKVPQYHAVNPVAAFAGAPRLSISGWFHGPTS